MRKLTGIAVFVIAGLVASSLCAATIVGTSRSEVIHGTARADRLDGKGGNDTIYGLGGNDVLVGGPGADLLVCGTGRDIARADAKDTVRKDCEVVTGLPAPLPPPAPPPPPPAPPPPPPVPRDGHYVGKTSQLEEFSFDVSNSGKTVTNVRFKRNESCEPADPRGGSSGPSGYFSVPGPIAVGADGDWSITGSGPLTYSPFGTGTFTAKISGKLDTSGRASGTLRVDSVFGERKCTSNDQTWTAAIP